jgi:hypothetical protein
LSVRDDELELIAQFIAERGVTRVAAAFCGAVVAALPLATERERLAAIPVVPDQPLSWKENVDRQRRLFWAGGARRRGRPPKKLKDC